MGGRTPDLLTVDDPAAIAAGGRRAHRPEQVGPAARFGEGNRCAQVARRDFRQEAPLLFFRAVQADRLHARKGRNSPDPCKPAQGPRQRAGEDHLHHHVAADAAIFLVDTKSVKPAFAQLLPQFEGVLVFLLLKLARPVLGKFCLNEAFYHVTEGAMFFGQVEVHAGRGREARTGLLVVHIKATSNADWKCDGIDRHF